MKQVTMTQAQYILSTNLILLPFVRKMIPRYMAIFGYSFKQPKAYIQL
ncbi:hypothetical protein NRA53_15650 [Acinetobacter baumannii]|nr:hypothetical protein [Acinetobacter baumannii]MDO7442327.1 hypothetical protein [Acinetobacter baumannii]MDV7665048.1 hypothetical protein [Acinetobacter baumannii]MDV7668615.1 hypothetical protein [Acinetobacter baumannii]